MTPAALDLDRILDDPGWDAVVVGAIALLAVEAPAQAQAVLVRLLDERQDDVFRHRFVLAAQALDLAGPSARGPLEPAATQVENSWAVWMHAWLSLGALERSAGLTSLSVLRPAMCPAQALGVVARAVAAGSRRSRNVALEAVRALGPSAASDSVFEALVAGVIDVPSPDARLDLLLTVSSIRRATDGLISALVSRLDGPHREMAVAWLASIGPPAASDSVIASLLALTPVEDASIQTGVIDALGRLGGGREQVLPVLLSRLDDPRPDVCVAAFEAVCHLGYQAADEGVVSTLVACTASHQREDVRCYLAPKALLSLGVPDATDAAREALLGLLTNSRPEVRRSGVRSIRRLGPRAAGTRIVAAIKALLEDPWPYVREEACRALEILGPAAGTTGVLDTLVALSTDWRRTTQPTVAVRAIAALAAVRPSTPVLLPTLLGILREGLWPSDDRDSAMEACRVVGRLGPAAATEACTAILSSLVGDWRLGAELREEAAIALTRIAPSHTMAGEAVDLLVWNLDRWSGEKIVAVLSEMGEGVPGSAIGALWAKREVAGVAQLIEQLLRLTRRRLCCHGDGVLRIELFNTGRI